MFPIDFEWDLQQCSATAMPVICHPRLTLDLFYLHTKHAALAITEINVKNLAV